MESAPAPVSTPASTSAFIPKSVTAPIPAHIAEHPVLPATKVEKKSQTKPVPTTPVPTTPEAQEIPMETATNLKRRRSSGEGTTKKMCSGPPCLEDPLEGPSNAFPQKFLPQQAPLQLPFPPPFLSLPPPPLPPLPPPQYRTPQHAPSEQQCSQPPQFLQHPQSPQPPQPPQPIELFHHPP